MRATRTIKRPNKVGTVSPSIIREAALEVVLGRTLKKYCAKKKREFRYIRLVQYGKSLWHDATRDLEARIAKYSGSRRKARQLISTLNEVCSKNLRYGEAIGDSEGGYMVKAKLNKQYDMLLHLFFGKYTTLNPRQDL